MEKDALLILVSSKYMLLRYEMAIHFSGAHSESLSELNCEFSPAEPPVGFTSRLHSAGKLFYSSCKIPWSTRSLATGSSGVEDRLPMAAAVSPKLPATETTQL